MSDQRGFRLSVLGKSDGDSADPDRDIFVSDGGEHADLFAALWKFHEAHPDLKTFQVEIAGDD